MAGESVLVIGGTGFIGAPLVAQLIEQGCDVKVFSRRSGKRKTDGVTYLQGDVTDIESVRRAVDAFPKQGIVPQCHRAGDELTFVRIGVLAVIEQDRPAECEQHDQH